MKRFVYEDLEEDPSVSLTPLIDIVFVILMAFMIAMPLIKIDRISLATGSSSHQAFKKQESQQAEIKVFRNHTITLNDLPMSLQELRSQLTVIHAQHPNIVPLLLQDGDTAFKLYQEIKSTIEEAGFQELHVALKN
ncbi:ExbD/TolR family protein [Chlamydia trachomatis]|uniref:ExbD/TolR family protein n=1 Tax=Chlamydia trachomatis TaxID=813 RepID=UPI0001D635A7|nr:biopolymer transporter ExbD [Chlamydia trachomatis]ADH18306.1 macromolecule transport protein [Chlamydia trachomatis G/9768]ADH20153.1 macromolecule transport protein [Chlamydia trachomatis G/11074]ADH97252.1 biopolymer transport protein ExbD [Chlamydia trachomatis G/9301]